MRRRQAYPEYEFRTRISGPFCVYCGEIADTYDHFPPHSLTRHGLLLPACGECNRFAATDYPLDFIGRVNNVKQKLKHRYKRNLKNISWSAEELNELGRGLYDGVELWMIQKEIAQKRVAWNAEVYLKFIDQDNVFVPALAEIEHIHARELRWLEPDDDL